MEPRWPLVPFGDFLKINLRPYKLGDMEDANLVGMRWFGLGPFHREHKLASRIKKKSHFRIQSGDVIYNKLFAWKGSFGIVPTELDGMLVSDKFPTYTLNRDLVDDEYLKLYFRLPYLWSQAESLSTGSAALSKFTLNPPKFYQLKMPLPPLEVQHRLAHKLQKCDEIIGQIIATRNDSYRIGQKILESAVNFIMNRLDIAGHFSDIIVFKPRSGPSFRTNPDGDGTPVIMPSAVTGFGVNITKVEYGFGNEIISPKDRLEPGDIIIARGNKRDQVGNAGVVPDVAKGWVCANLLMRFKTDNSAVIPDFVIYWLRSTYMRNLVARTMKGTNPNILKINQKNILSFPFPTTCSLKEQKSIVGRLNEISENASSLISMQDTTQSQMGKVFTSLLYHSLFTSNALA
jgi:type I restriction enzyme S subunit